jgi:hypothetical protein
MLNDIPTYKISADQIEEGVDLIAVTANPAIMVKGVKLSIVADTPAKAMEFSGERMVIAGPALIPDKKIYRSDEDGEYYVVFEKDVIAQMVEKFAATKSSHVFNVEHTAEQAPAFILEHWIVEDSEMDKSKKFGFDLPVGTWFVMAKITDKKFWDEQVKDNDKFGFSIEGLLGLKLNREKMKKNSKAAKFAKMKTKHFAKISKFDTVAGVDAAEGDAVIVAADEMAVGQEVVVVTEGLEEIPDFTGEVEVDGETIVIEDGAITAVSEAVAEEVTETEEVTMTEEKEEEEVAMEEVVVEEQKTLTEEDVRAIVKPMFDELYTVIAELKNSLMEEEAAEEVAMTAVERKFAALRAATNAINARK